MVTKDYNSIIWNYRIILICVTNYIFLALVYNGILSFLLIISLITYITFVIGNKRKQIVEG